MPPIASTLSIPDIARRVASHLDTANLSHLTGVCRELHDAYSPLLFREVFVQQRKNGQFSAELLKQFVQRVCSWVRVLHIESLKDMAVWVQHCSNLHTLDLVGELHPKAIESWDLVTHCINSNPSLRTLYIHTPLTTETTCRIVQWIKSRDSSPSSASSMPCSPLREIAVITNELSSSDVVTILDASPETLERFVVYLCVEDVSALDLQKVKIEDKQYPSLLEFTIHVNDPFLSSVDEDCFWRIQYPIWRQSPNQTTFIWPELSEGRKIKKMLAFFKEERVQRSPPGSVAHPPSIVLDFRYCGLKLKHITRIISSFPQDSICNVIMDDRLKRQILETALDAERENPENLLF